MTIRGQRFKEEPERRDQAPYGAKSPLSLLPASYLAPPKSGLYSTPPL